MKRHRNQPRAIFGFLMLVGLAASIGSSQHSLQRSAGERAGRAARLAPGPLYFEPNRGQANAQVKMLARGAGMFFRSEDVALMLPSGSSAVELKWIGGNPSPAIVGENLQAGRSNYF